MRGQNQFHAAILGKLLKFYPASDVLLEPARLTCGRIIYKAVCPCHDLHYVKPEQLVLSFDSPLDVMRRHLSAGLDAVSQEARGTT